MVLLHVAVPPAPARAFELLVVRHPSSHLWHPRRWSPCSLRTAPALVTPTSHRRPHLLPQSASSTSRNKRSCGSNYLDGGTVHELDQGLQAETIFLVAAATRLLSRHLPPPPNLEVSDVVVEKAADQTLLWINKVLAVTHDIYVKIDMTVYRYYGVASLAEISILFLVSAQLKMYDLGLVVKFSLFML